MISDINSSWPDSIKRVLRKPLILFREIYRYVEKQYTKLYIKICPVNSNKIIFDNFFGKAYGDNPRYIADEIHRQGLDWDMVWLVRDDNSVVPPYVRTVWYGSEKAIREMATAKVVVRNIRNGMHVPKRDGQIFLQTWHGGLGFKKVEGAAEARLSPQYVRAD